MSILTEAYIQASSDTHGQTIIITCYVCYMLHLQMASNDNIHVLEVFSQLTRRRSGYGL